MQALLTEVRELRQSIQAMTVSSQRVRILIFNLQMQDAAVSRSSQRLNEAKTRCSAIESRRRSDDAAIQHVESDVASGKLGPNQTKELQANTLAEVKRMLDLETADLQTCRVAESEAESQVRNDQAKLADAQEKIDRLEKELDKAAAGK